MNWADKYVGIPYQEGGRTVMGVDCWGLYYLVLKHEFGIIVPTYEGHIYHPKSKEEQEKLIAYIQGETKKTHVWQEIKPGDEIAGDAIRLKVIGRILHIGVVVDPKTKIMIQTLEHNGTIISKYNSVSWKNRVVGFNRYVGSRTNQA